MQCKICKKEFIPSKYRLSQQVCSQPACQRQRQIQNERDWHAKNPDYFKSLGQEPAWRSVRQRYNKLWRQGHREYLETYTQAKKEQHREYMRGYMREYRKSHPS